MEKEKSLYLRIKEAWKETCKMYSDIIDYLEEKTKSTDYYEKKYIKNEAEPFYMLTFPIQFVGNFIGKNYWGVRVEREDINKKIN